MPDKREKHRLIPPRQVKLTLKYDGTGFSGWQLQKKGRTVQQVVEDALKKLTGNAVRVSSSGRTDSGVHAKAMVACFRTGSRLPASTIKKAMNGMLPADVVVTGAKDVGSGFHPRFDVALKRYRYQILNSRDRDPFLRHQCLFFPGKLDVARMREAGRELTGTHDFRSFQVGGEAKTTVRMIKSIKVRKRGRIVTVDVEGTGFLHKMVRRIVGTLIDAGTGRKVREDVRKMLQAADSRFGGAPVAPAGLFLVSVKY